MNLIEALVEHTKRLLCFQHTGKGWPETRSGLIPIVVTLFVLTGVFHHQLNTPPNSIAVASLLPLVIAGLMVTIFRPAVALIIALPYIAGSLLGTIAILFLGEEGRIIDLTLGLWSLFAVFHGAFQYGKHKLQDA